MKIKTWQKRIAVTVLVVALSISAVFATTMEEYLVQAMAASAQVQRYEMNRTNSLLSLQKADAEETNKWTIDLGTVTYSPLADGTSTVLNYGDPGVSVTIPTSDDSLNYTAGVSTSLTVTADKKTSGTVKPSLGLTKVYDLGYVYDVSDLTRARQLLQIENTYQTNLLNFQVTFINEYKSIISSQLSVESAGISLGKSEASLQKSLLLKNVTEGTVKYMDLVNAIDGQKISLENSQEKLKVQISNFERKYGITFTQVEVSEEPVPTVEALENGNSTVLLAQYQYQLDAEAVKNKTALTQTLTANAGLGGTFALSSDPKSSLNANAGASYSGSDGWSASGSVSLGWNINTGKLTPSISIGGKYVPSNTKAKDDIELQELQYQETTSKIDWDDKLSDYLDQVVDMQSSIRTLEGQIRTAKADLEYASKSVETEKLKLDLGMTTESAVDDALFNEKKAQSSLEGYYLDVIVLEKKIALMQL